MQGFDDSRINRIDLADEADIDKLARLFTIWHFHFARTDQAAIFTRQTNSLTTVMIDQHHDVLLYLTTQHPFNDLHGFFIGDAHTLNECSLFTNLFERIINLWSTTVHHNRIHPNQL